MSNKDNFNVRELEDLQHRLKVRETELALLEGIARAVGENWDMQAIYDLVGLKLSELFQGHSIIIANYDQQTGLGSFPFLLEEGRRIGSAPRPVSEISIGRKLIEDPTPIKLDTMEEFDALGLKTIGDSKPSYSGIFAPMVSSERVYGGLSIQSLEEEFAFTDADLNLLVTIANSIGQALENAYLFDQAQRLLEESRQRNAELELLNSVQQGLVAELELQAIYDLVGDKVREIFHAQAVLIAIYDHQKNVTSVPYLFEKGERYFIPDSPSSGLCEHFQDNPRTLVINENMEEASKKYNLKVRIGEAPKSLIFVPLIVGKEVTGHISLQCIDRENAFGDSDIRLLETLAASMSVALENARLFGEIQRRNAELAVINSVQEGLVAQIRMDAIYELVGDQIRDIFDAQVVTVNRFDFEKRLNEYWYVYEKGQRFTVPPQPIAPIIDQFVAEGRPLMLNENTAEFLREGGGQVVAGEEPKSFLAVPLWSDNQVSGSISLQNVDREHAFNDDHKRLLSTVAASTSVALENARLFAMIKRRAKEMSALAEVGRDISATLDLPTVLERIARHARDLLNVKDSAVFLPDDSGRIMRGYVALGPIAAQVKATVVEPGVGILGHIWQSAEPEVINHAQHDPRAVLISGTEQQEDEKIMVAPLFSGAQVTGLMAVWRTGGDNFYDADLEFFVGLSRQAAIAIENARLFSDAEIARATAEEASRSKSAFLANVSHELRTPLTSILGFAHVLQRRFDRHIQPLVPADNAQAQHAMTQIEDSLDVIVSEGERLTTLINNVLDLEKIEAGRMEWDMKPLDLGQVLEQGIEATSAIIEQKGLELRREIATNLPVINGDHDKLVQVVINLLSNAIKFTAQGEITCRAQAVEGAVRVSIRDTGEGIAQEHLERVFEKFQQVGDTLTEKPRGTGLGLPICKEIVERHGGRIWVESAPGKGSTFSFIVPVENDIDADNVKRIDMDDLLSKLKEKIAVVPGTSANGRKSILVADDDDAIRKLLVEELQSEGYRVYQAADGREALELLKSDAIDLVILDILMPELSGFEVAAVIKHDPQTMGLPIVVISVLEDKERGYLLGVDRYLTKPIAVPKLLKEVEALLNQGGSRRRIMVIDEDVNTVELLSSALQRQGFEVTAVTSGDEGIRSAVADHPDMIIVDAALSEEHQMVQTIRFEKGLENVFFLLFQK